jgi:DNA-binding MarR family transcriptional regulator
MSDPGCNAAADAGDMVARIDEQFARAFRRVRRGTARVLAPFGITGGQARVLRALGRAGAPLRVGDVAARLGIVPRSATTMVDTLEVAGLVERRANQGDRRSVLVALTASGEDLLAQMAVARHESAESVFGRLDETQQGDLLDLLTALNECDEPDGRTA